MTLAFNRSQIYLLLAVLLIAALLYLRDWERNPLSIQQEPAEENLPYAVARNAATTHFSEEGELEYTFEAKVLEYYREEEEDKPATEYTLVRQPRVVLYLEDEPWRIIANEGMYSEQENKLILWDDVKVTQSRIAGQDTELLTSRLEIYPARKLAETREPVKITSAWGEIDAVGMRADLAERKIKLLSKVQGRHDPI